MIEIIPNQPILFYVDGVDDGTDCECLGQCFTQKVNTTDQTVFQFKSQTEVVGEWLATTALRPTIVTTLAEPDGSVNVTAVVGGSGAGYQVSYLNNSSYEAIGTPHVLPAGVHAVFIRDGALNEVLFFAQVFAPVVCGDYAGATLADMIDAGVALIQLQNCALEDLY